MAATAFSTDILPGAQRAAGWVRAIGQSYFPLELEFRTPERFSGELRKWSLGEVEASRLRSDAAMYRRRPDHLNDAGEEELLLTIPRSAPVRFLQMGREVVCPPGGFILERGNEPYEFSYGSQNDLMVAKIGYRALAGRLRDPGRYCAIEFDAKTGVAALMVDLLRSSGSHAAELTDHASLTVGRQLVDLLAMAVEQDPRAAGSGETTVREAHLHRIVDAIARLMSDPDLTPGRVAAECGISLRYLHDICQQDGPSFGERLREARLLAVRRALFDPRERRSITEIAFCQGFRDASSFSRAFRARFGEAPRAVRARARSDLPEL